MGRLAQTLGLSFPMIIYLDQNKWIELSKMFHGKDKSARAGRVLNSFKQSVATRSAITPLSAIHYMETSRISNLGRRSRLGETMWEISQGFTIANYSVVVRVELAKALSKHFPQITAPELVTIARGSAHAFGLPPMSGLRAAFETKIERSMLVGDPTINLEPLAFKQERYRDDFRMHLLTLLDRSKSVPENMKENWLYATVTADMALALSDVLQEYNLSLVELESLGVDRMRSVVDDMPTRHLDLHLRRQVLANPKYVPKLTDLEDWAGLGVAACYCDVVVCEKHMADMLRRNRYKTKARIEIDIENAFST